MTTHPLTYGDRRGSAERSEMSGAHWDTKHKIHFITVANKPRPELEILKRSCQSNNIELTILGLNREDIKIGHGIGFGWKLILLRNFLEDKKDTDLFIFVDGYDVVVNATLPEIVHKFLLCKTDILFSAEKFCWPDVDKSEEYKIRPNDRPIYLNSGTFMGFIGPFKKLYDENTAGITENTDDQRHYTAIYLKYQFDPQTIKLDHDSKIFMCLSGSMNLLKYDPIKKRFQNKQSNQYPCIFHANGGDKKFIYQFDKKINRKFQKPTEQFNQIKKNKSNLSWIIILVLVIIFAFYFYRQYRKAY